MTCNKRIKAIFIRDIGNIGNVRKTDTRTGLRTLVDSCRKLWTSMRTFVDR